MAARDKQGYLIAVIVLVLLSLILALTTFLGLSKMNEYADNKAAAEQKLKVEDKVREANELQSQILKAMIGDLGPTVAEMKTTIDRLNGLASGLEDKARVQAVIDSVAAAKESFDKDMLANGSTGDAAADQDGTYKLLVKNLSTVLGRKHNELNVVQQRAKLAKQDAETDQKNAQAAVDAKTAEVAQLTKDLEEEKASNAKNVLALRESLDQGKNELIDISDKFADYKNVSIENEEKLNKSVNAFQVANAGLKDELNEIKREVFDAPDGRIVKVAHGLNTVFLDLGRQDGVTANRSFTIYDRSITNFEKNKHKASIEVIRVHETQSEARILEEDPSNPILTGDFVLTPVWDPGHSVAIALAGFFDLDNDGVSDMEKLKQLIRRNGGTVVASHDEDGIIDGEIDSNVRYLVLGERPNLGVMANPAVVRAMDDMEALAKENTVQVIDLRKMLIRMGVRVRPKLQKLDTRRREFEERNPSDTLKSSDR